MLDFQISKNYHLKFSLSTPLSLSLSLSLTHTETYLGVALNPETTRGASRMLITFHFSVQGCLEE